MIGMGGSFNEVPSENDSYYDLETLKKKLKEYLLLGSCDGKMERKQLRRELATLIGASYDDKKDAIK